MEKNSFIKHSLYESVEKEPVLGFLSQKRTETRVHAAKGIY